MEQPELEREVRDLAQRIPAIESRLGLSSSRRCLARRRHSSMLPPSRRYHRLLPVLGRSLLGLAGAYPSARFTESGSLPVRAGVAIGILYAIGWLVSAARTPAERRIGAALSTASPPCSFWPRLLWEATLRFHAISTWTAGAILLCFTVSGLAVSWRKDLLIVATIATLAGLGTAAALLVATHDVVPFTFVFLAIAAAVEVSACLDHWLS